jgi:hypothetical protein
MDVTAFFPDATTVSYVPIPVGSADMLESNESKVQSLL